MEFHPNEFLLEYEGNKVFIVAEGDSDGFSKLDHHVVLKDGSQIEIDFTPYSKISEEAFIAYLILGCPDRIGYPAWDNDSLIDELVSVNNGGEL